MSIKKRIRDLGKRIKDLDARLGKLPRQQLVLLMTAIALLFIMIGTGLGLVFINPSTTPTQSEDGTNSSEESGPETVSLTGVLRELDEPQNGIEFYLEKSDESRVLLDTAARFDSDFLRSSKGTFVTVEGTLTEGTDDSEDILSVEKLSISY